MSLFFITCGRPATTVTPSPPPIVKNDTETTEGPTAAPDPSPTPPPQLYSEYTASLEIDPPARSINGIQRIKYVNTSGVELDTIYCHLYLNAFQKGVEPKPYFPNFDSKIFESGQDYGYIQVSHVSINNEDIAFSIDGTLLKIDLRTPLPPKEPIELKLQFEAVVPKINHRSGANDYAMWCGNMLPILAVCDKHGWHTDKYYPAGDPFYSDIANYTVSISAPAGYIVAGTGISSETTYGDMKTTTLTANLVREFAFVIGRYAHVANITTKAGVQIYLYTYTDLPNTGKLLDLAAHSLHYFSERVGDYPYASLAIVECGLFLSGGMEYPGIVFVDSAYLKKDSTYKSIAHEIGHQWFYNIVGNNQAAHPWIDEGMTMLVQEGIFTNEAPLDQKMKDSYDGLRSKLGAIKVRNMSSNLNAYESWSNYYDINYTKAKLMIYSLSLKMGQDRFDRFLKEYYAKNAYGIVDRQKFIETAEEIYGGDLQGFFNDWIDGDDLPPLETLDP